MKILSLINTPHKNKECDRDSYDINKAAKHIAEATKKKDSQNK